MSTTPEIEPRELSDLLQKGQAPFLIDVRESLEKDIADIGGVLIPLGELSGRLAEIPEHSDIVVYCRSGARSARAVDYLLTLDSFRSVKNLRGGILAWSEEVDPSVPQY